MSLKEELKLKKGFGIVEHETVLNVYFTAACLKKCADAFFKSFGLTDVQFNVMMLLVYQGGSDGGLSQAQLSDMMLVNRANITTLIDRMEKAGLVIRTSDSADRRTNIIKLTPKGKGLFTEAEPYYDKQIKKMMAGLNQSEQKKLISILEKARAGLKE